MYMVDNNSAPNYLIHEPNVGLSEVSLSPLTVPIRVLLGDTRQSPGHHNEYYSPSKALLRGVNSNGFIE